MIDDKDIFTTSPDARKWWDSLTQTERDDIMRQAKPEIDRMLAGLSLQPAARGGGDEWEYIETRYAAEIEANGYRIRAHWHGVADGETVRAMMRSITDQHNQHRSLVAERERLRAFVKEFADKGCVLRGETCLERSAVSPCIRCRAVALLVT